MPHITAHAICACSAEVAVNQMFIPKSPAITSDPPPLRQGKENMNVVCIEQGNKRCSSVGSLPVDHVVAELVLVDQKR